MQRKILVVEDYPDLRTALVSVLASADYVCDVATSAEAVAMMREGNYSTVLLDPTLPINDDPVMRYLEHQPVTAARVILMTEPDQPTGDYRCLMKPFNAAELFARMRS